MSNSLPRRIALRYLWSKNSETFITIISVLSVLGVAIGVMVLNVVMAVMTGFQYELREKFLGNSSHVLVQSFAGQIDRWQDIEKKIESVPGVQSVSPFTYHQALLRIENRSAGIFIRGIEPGSEAASRLLGRVVEGVTLGAQEAPSEKLVDESEAILPPLIIGAKLQERMKLDIGDLVSVLSPQVSSSPFGLIPKYRRFRISGVYRSGLTEYENVIAFTEMDAAQNFFRFGDSISGFEVQGADPELAPALSQKILQNISGGPELLYTQDWTETNRPLWEALRLEKFVYFLVLLLIIVMASFSIVATLILLVLQKRRDIAVLRSLGASKSTVGKIFRIQGALIGFFGTGLGVLGSYLACAGLKAYRFPLDSNVFPVSELPIRIESINFFITALAAFCICYLVTGYPARRAATVDPATVLRYE